MKKYCIALIGILISCSPGISADTEYDIDTCYRHLQLAKQAENSACDRLIENKKALEELAYRTVKFRLKDPYSAKFKDIKVFDDYVSGTVNSKNSLGAYTGAKWFRLEYENGHMKFSMAR